MFLCNVNSTYLSPRNRIYVHFLRIYLSCNLLVTNRMQWEWYNLISKKRSEKATRPLLIVRTVSFGVTLESQYIKKSHKHWPTVPVKITVNQQNLLPDMQWLNLPSNDFSLQPSGHSQPGVCQLRPQALWSRVKLSPPCPLNSCFMASVSKIEKQAQSFGVAYYEAMVNWNATKDRGSIHTYILKVSFQSMLIV